MSTQSKPLVSVIIPVFQGEAFLAEAIQSVLDQKHRPLEIIVVDDGSTDASAQIAQGFGSQVQYVYQTNQGPSAARNTGLQLAKGAFLAFNDADDIWMPEKLEQQLSFLSSSAETDIVFGHLQCICPQPSDPQQFKNCYEPFKIYHFGSSLVRQEVVAQVGKLNESMRYSEDIDWFMRAKEAGVGIYFQEQVVVLYRLHEKNATRFKGRRDSGFLLALKKSMDRRRNTAQRKESKDLD